MVWYWIDAMNLKYGMSNLQPPPVIQGWLWNALGPTPTEQFRRRRWAPLASIRWVGAVVIGFLFYQ